MKLLLLLLTAVTFVKAQNVPDCVATCVQQASKSFDGPCTDYNDPCFCTMAFQQVVGPCISNTCDSVDIAAASDKCSNDAGTSSSMSGMSSISSSGSSSISSSGMSSSGISSSGISGSSISSSSSSSMPSSDISSSSMSSSSSSSSMSSISKPSTSINASPPTHVASSTSGGAGSSSSSSKSSNAASARAEFGYGNLITLGVAAAGAAIGSLVI